MPASPYGKDINTLNELRLTFRDESIARCNAILEVTYAIALIRTRIAMVSSGVDPQKWLGNLAGIAQARAELAQLTLNLNWISHWLEQYHAKVSEKLALHTDLRDELQVVYKEAGNVLAKRRAWHESTLRQVKQSESAWIDFKVQQAHAQVLDHLERQEGRRLLKRYLGTIANAVAVLPTQILTLPKSDDKTSWRQSGPNVVMATHRLLELLPTLIGPEAARLDMRPELDACIEQCRPAMAMAERNLQMIMSRHDETNGSNQRFALMSEPTGPLPAGPGNHEIPIYQEASGDCNAFVKWADALVEKFSQLVRPDNYDTTSAIKMIAVCSEDNAGHIKFAEVGLSVKVEPILVVSREEMQKDANPPLETAGEPTSIDERLKRFTDEIERIGREPNIEPVDALHEASLEFSREREALLTEMKELAQELQKQMNTAQVEFTQGSAGPKPEFLVPPTNEPISLIPTPKAILVIMLEMVIALNPVSAGIYTGLNLLSALLFHKTLFQDNVNGSFDMLVLLATSIAPLHAVVPPTAALKAAQLLAKVLSHAPPAATKNLQEIYKSGALGAQVVLKWVENGAMKLSSLPLIKELTAWLKHIEELGQKNGRPVAIEMVKQGAQSVVIDVVKVTGGHVEMWLSKTEPQPVDVEFHVGGKVIDGNGNFVEPSTPGTKFPVLDVFPHQLDPLWL